MYKASQVLLTAVLIAGFAAACSQTRYTRYDEAAEQTNPFDRQVEFELTRHFYDDPPRCVVVMPFLVDGKRHPKAEVIETALARHLSGKVERVMGPRARDRAARSLAVDLTTETGRSAFARSARCGFQLEAEPWGGESMYAVFWTQSRIGLQVQMTRVEDQTLIWRARHVAKRSEGGLPLSPLSAVYNLFTATEFRADGDVDLSLADDAARRICKTFPDTRSFGFANAAGGRP